MHTGLFPGWMIFCCDCIDSIFFIAFNAAFFLFMAHYSQVLSFNGVSHVEVTHLY